MTKNPFSLHDFLGYVFPGAFALLLIYVFAELPSFDGITSFYIELLNFLEVKSNFGFSFEIIVILTLLSYIVGHFVAYLSSLTVEHFSNWLYGYPSFFLLKDVPPNYYWNVMPNIINSVKGVMLVVFKLFWRLVIAVFLLPLTLGTLIIAKGLGVKYFFIKKLDESLIKNIESRCIKLMTKINYECQDEDTDFHRVVYHYVYEHQKLHAVKLDNYVALYGFLRAMTFIFNCTSLYIMYLYLCNPANGKMLLFLFTIFVITYIFFMSFVKFYRRFTLESFMCLLTDDTLHDQVCTETINITIHNHGK